MKRAKLQRVCKFVSKVTCKLCWQVIANIPTFFDKGTSNNIENYSLDETGSVGLRALQSHDVDLGINVHDGSVEVGTKMWKFPGGDM